MENFKKIGLITYHSAYNFGSVLQAFATQQSLIKLGYNSEIINYRMTEQKYFYQHACRFKYGWERGLKDITQLPLLKKRKKRADSFEKFFKEFLFLSSEINKPEEVEKNFYKYSTIISGSDQIWNKHSCELAHVEWKYMEPYLLKGFKGHKISYASSLGSMTPSEIRYILPEIQKFDALSFRESTSASEISKLLKKKVEHVLDPTFLLTEEEWVNELKLKKYQNKEPYILFYFLSGSVKQALRLVQIARFLSDKNKCKVKMIMPFIYIPTFDSNVENCMEMGPREFLEILYNAQKVITDSYHGTILSINFHKDFESICGRSKLKDNRRTDILSALGLFDRFFLDLNECLNSGEYKKIDYFPVQEKLNSLRKHSLDYLKTSLCE